MIPITGHTQLTALLGSPVAHSISPLMHNEAFHLLDLDYTYLCFNVNEENLETAVMGLKTCGIRGFNLTMPNKNKIVELLDELSPAARLIGAVNTVVNDNGRLTGYNTDGVGYMQAVRDAGYDVIGKTIIIMGAGGAATAICAQAALDGVKKIHIFARETSRFWNRTQKLVENINATLPCQAILHENKDKEELEITPEIRPLISRQAGRPAIEQELASAHSEFKTLRENAIQLVEEGITTAEEVQRVIYETGDMKKAEEE